MKTHGMSIFGAPCAEIKVGERHRKDMGDLQALAASIASEGLLQPIGITEDNLLVFGERRLLAVRDILREPTIVVRVVHVSSILAGEYAENEIRKDFTPSERVAIGKALECEIGSRQGQRTDLQPQANCPEVPSGTQTRELIASKAGFDSYKTYERAKKVVEQGVEEVVAQMDSEHLSIHAASVIAELPPDQQREIAHLPENEKKVAVRKLRRKDLPSTKEARRQALQTGKAILDRNLMYQLPVTEQQKPLVEQNYAAMAIIDAITALSRCPHPAQAIAAAIRRLDTPDMDFPGRCSTAANYLNQINQEMNSHGQ